MRIPLVDLDRQRRAIAADLDAAISEVLTACDFVRGEACGRFEQAFAEMHGVEHAVGVGNGTDALFLALMAVGVQPGQEVVTAANTFAATAEAIVAVGAVPVFADVDEQTLCLDPADLAAAITERTAAVIPVHLHGHPSPMAEISAIAEEHGLTVIEDAAQAQDCQVGDRKAGAWGHAGCFSFYPSKNLGAFGDGGMVTTSDPAMAETLRILHNHGRSGGRHTLVGHCSRLDTIQAAVLGAKLPHLPRWNEQRRELARQYDAGLAGCEAVRRPLLHDGAVYHHYVIHVEDRDGLRVHLRERGIASGLHYDLPVAREPAYRQYDTRPTPVADHSARRKLSLPLFPELEPAELQEVVDAVVGFCESEQR